MQRWARECNWGFFIGPDKAGSSWMQEVLQRHPTVTVPVSKDLHFFNRFHRRGIDWYLRQFDPEEQTTTAVEVCHDYLFDEQAIVRIVDAFPNAKLVVCARHPAERAVSSYLYMVRQGRTRLDLSAALREIDELVDHGRYHAHLSTVLEHVARDAGDRARLRQLVTIPAAFKAGLLAGLGADPDPLSPEDLEPVRVAARPRSVRRGPRREARGRSPPAAARRGDPRAAQVQPRWSSGALVPHVSRQRAAGLECGRFVLSSYILEPDAQALDAMLGTRFRAGLVA